MIGGESAVVKQLDPIFATLAPGVGDIPHTPGRHKLGGTSEQGYLDCGPNGRRPLREDGSQRHRVWNHGRVRRGTGRLAGSQPGQEQHEIDAETTTLRDPEHYREASPAQNLRYPEQ
jgi:6-phosphogluconate dehydrogenase